MHNGDSKVNLLQNKSETQVLRFTNVSRGGYGVHILLFLPHNYNHVTWTLPDRNQQPRDLPAAVREMHTPKKSHTATQHLAKMTMLLLSFSKLSEMIILVHMYNTRGCLCVYDFSSVIQVRLPTLMYYIILLLSIKTKITAHVEKEKNQFNFCGPLKTIK